MTVRSSRRLPWNATENPLARAEQARRAAGLPIVDLTVSNPTAVGLPYPRAAIAAAFAREENAVYEPAALGLPAARAAIAADFARRGVTIAADRIALCAGTSEAYSALFKIHTDPGDAICVPQPSYPLFEHLARLDGLTPRPYRLALDGRWFIDWDTVDLDGVRLAIAVSPNNPTGSVLSRAELAHLQRLCAERAVPLIVDEVFADHWHAPPADAIATAMALPAPALTYSLGGLSKSCGLPQAKLAFIAVAGPDAEVRAVMTRLELCLDAYLSLGTPVQHALPALLALGTKIRGALADRVHANLRALHAALAGAPISVLPVEAGWSAILRLPSIATDDEWALALLGEDGVLVQPGFFFDLELPSTVVVSLLPPPEAFADGIGRLRRRVASRAV